MGPRQERQLAGLFFSLGRDSCINARARMVQLEPWRRDGLGNEDTMGNDALLQTGVENATRGAQGSLAASAALTSKYGPSGVRALQAAGISARNIGRISAAVRGLRAATRGMGAIGDVWDQLTILGAFAYSDSLLVSRYRNRLEGASVREGYEEFAQYADKVQPFFETVLEFITLTAMSIEGMPPEEVNAYAIEAAFQYNDIPMTEDLRAHFYEPAGADAADAEPSPEAAQDVESVFGP